MGTLPEIVELCRNVLQTICLSALLAMGVGVGLWWVCRLLKPLLASLSGDWRISKTKAFLRVAICGGVVVMTTIYAGTKNNQAHAPTRAPAPHPVVQSVQREMNGDVHEESVVAFDPGTSAPVVTNGFQIAGYVYTNGVMDMTVAWSGPLKEGAVEAAHGDSLTNKVFLGCWRVLRDQRALRILARPMALGLSDSGFVWLRPANDSDADGASDWYEVYGLGSSLLLADSDSDGIPDEFEAAHGLNPVVDDYEDAPKLRVGGSDGISLKAALAAAAPYSIIEIGAGVYSVNDVNLPDRPILITSPNRGRSRQVVFRCTGTYALGVRLSSKSRIVVQGIRFDLVRDGNLQAGVWLGEPLMFGGEGASAWVLNCRFMMSRPDTHYFGVFSRGWNDQRIVIAGCEFNALGSTAVRGVSLVDSPDVYVEGCSFVNFPKDGMFESSAIHYESTSENLGGRPGITRLGVVNTLFDNSFTNAYVFAPLVSGMGYEVSMSSSVIPSVPEYEAHSTSNVIVGNVSVNSRGYLLPGSIGIGQGVSPIYSTIDVNGVTRGGVVDIGAARYIDPSSNQDTDQDGIRDWDEIEDGTDPTLADTDGDNIDDGIESSEETNPLSKLDYCFSADITIENPEREDTPASVALFASGSATEPVSAVVYATNGVNSLLIPHRRALGETPYRLVAWHDSNENGILDDETVFDEWSFTPNAHAATRTVRLPSRDDDSDGDGLSDWHEVVAHGTNRRKADSDGDGIPDGVEVGEATDPLNPSNYCFGVHIAVTNRVVGSGTLCWAVASSNECGVVFLTTPTSFLGMAREEFDIPHQVVSDGSPHYLVYWIDRDKNGLFDQCSELYMMARLPVLSHSNTLQLVIDSKIYDRDSDGIPDWWELRNGLNPFERLDAYEDGDHDGLINLHEYWTNCDPTVEDGEGYLISYWASSIDGMITNRDVQASVAIFSDYQEADSVYELNVNTNFWLSNVDMSGMGIWTTQGYNRQRGPVAVSSRHVMMATHWPVGKGQFIWFKGTDGVLYSNKVVQVKNLWTDDVSARNLDLAVGLLETNLPSCVSIVPIMGSNLVSKVGSGQCLPVIQLNQDKQAHVNEVNTLEPNNKAQISFRTAICSWRSEWSLVGRSGDSGSPVFALLGNQLVLLGSLHTAMGTPSYCDLGDLIQQAMNELLPSHNNILQRYNLDRWADLPIRNEERQ